MKKVIIAAILMVLGPMARGQDVPVRGTNLFNFGDFFHSVRAGYGIDQHGQKSTVFYTALYDLHNTAGVSMVTLNLGYEGTLKRPTIMLGLRADNLVPLIWSSNWGQVHVTTAKLPTFECGPWLSVWPKGSGNLWEMDIRYGAGAAIGF